MDTRIPSKVEMTAKIIRADGTVEELGVIASWSRNPFLQALRQMKAKLEKKNGN